MVVSLSPPPTFGVGSPRPADSRTAGVSFRGDREQVLTFKDNPAAMAAKQAKNEMRRQVQLLTEDNKRLSRQVGLFFFSLASLFLMHTLIV